VTRRIGLDARMLGKTGIGTYVAGLLGSLPAALGDTLVVFVRPETRGQAQALVGEAGNVELHDAPGAIYQVREQVDLPWRLRAARLDLLHAPHYNQPIWCGPPTVVTIHDLIPLVYPQNHSWALPRWWNRVLIERAVSGARRLIAPSQHTATDLQRRLGVPAARITVISEGVQDAWRQAKDAGLVGRWLDPFHLARPYLFYTGQWKPYKNVSLLLEAFALLMRRYPDLRLAVGGRPDPRYPEIPRRARELGDRVRLTGWIAEEALPFVMAGACAFVLPSEYEGFGLPVLEAMAAGTPVVCARAASLPEVAGEAACYWEPFTGAEGLASAIEQVLKPAEAERLRTLGRRQAAGFSWAEAARATVEVYHEALGTESVSPAAR